MLSYDTQEFNPLVLHDLVGDIGGTNARLVLVLNGRLQIDSLRVFPTRQFNSLESVLQLYQRELKVPIARASLALATSIPDDLQATIRFTNHNWVFSRSSLLQALGLQQLVLLNDFAALARALPLLKSADLQQIGSGEIEKNATKAVLGPGTGLGVASLVFSGSEQLGWLPITGEGGHASLSPGSVLETEILQVVWQDFPHISWERLVSGIGLPTLYQAMATLRGHAQPLGLPSNRDIVTSALTQTDVLAQEVIEVFCGLLGSAAGNLALTVGAKGGVYLGGGIALALKDYLPQSAFRKRFVAKGRFQGYLEAIPTYLITAQHPALLGCAAALSK